MDTQNERDVADPMVLSALSQQRFVVGAKQLHKALLSGKAERVFLAEDADPAITEPVEALCQMNSVACVWVRSKTCLGRACGIEVGAAAAAVISDSTRGNP